jgi:glycosyltransferase involved in cell wall biosynthesis
MKKILYSCGIDTSGYSNGARTYIHGLYKNKEAHIRVKINNVANNINTIGIDPKDLDFFYSISSNKINDFDYFIQHNIPDRYIFSDKKCHIGYTIAEMHIPQRWVSICNFFDIIITPSVFSKKMFIESGMKEEKIHIIPHCYDYEKWNINIKPLEIDGLKDFNFLFVGDYTPRKGGDILIRNYLKTFRGIKNVTLTIKAYFNSFSKKDQDNLVKRIKKIVKDSLIPEKELPTIYFYGDPIDECTMPSFMQTFDCLVSPHHGEGWGLCLSQMQSLGKPVIATNYSGNLDFMKKDISYLIEVSGFERVCEEMEKININFVGKEWVKINEKSLCDLMYEAYNNKDKAMEKGFKAYNYMRYKYTDDKISKKFLDIL